MKLPRNRRRQRGAAYTETVVMLPFFFIVWTSIMHVHKAYAGQVKLMAENRNCVMTYAYDACQRTPPGCSLSHGSSGTDAPDEFGGFMSTLGSFGDGLLSSVTGATTSSRMTRSVSAPRPLGGSASLAASNAMQCNTRYQDSPVRAVRDAFRSLVGI